MALDIGNGIMIYTPPDAARMIGIPLSTLNWWAKTGFIAPSLGASRGKGHSRYYSFNDLVSLKIAQQLRVKGISLQGLRRVVDYLRKRDGSISPLTAVRLAVINSDVHEFTDSEELYSLLKNPGQGEIREIALVDVGEVVRELNSSPENAQNVAA